MGGFTPTTTAQAVETLRQFVIRALHIETHSLVADRARLGRYAQGEAHATFALDGTTHIEREYPDEEAMESLASRVRPLTLAGEPIHHAKVMAAIEFILTSRDSGPRAQDLAAISGLRDAWHRYGLDEDSEIGYVLSTSMADGSRPTIEANDIQLAAGWFYADVAHANPTGWKQQALLFPRAMRFEAAVLRWSMLALTAVRTLDFVRQLHGEGLLGIPEDAFEPDLATDRPTPEQTIMMIAPRDTPMPPLTARPSGPEWKLLNVGTAARLMPSNRVGVRLSRDAQEIAHQPGAVIDKLDDSGDTLSLAVLVDEAVVFHLQGPRTGSGSSQLRQEIVWKTNAAVRDGSRFLNLMRTSDAITFGVAGVGEFRFDLTPSAQDLAGADLAHYAEDLAAIEVVLGRTLPKLDSVPAADRRLAIHLVRLAMEGHVVEGVAGPIDVTVDHDNPPHEIAARLRPLEVSGERVELPTLLVWHPDAVAASIGPRRWMVSLPSGGPFLVWDPNAIEVRSDAHLTATAWLGSWDPVDSVGPVPEIGITPPEAAAPLSL